MPILDPLDAETILSRLKRHLENATWFAPRARQCDNETRCYLPGNFELRIDHEALRLSLHDHGILRAGDEFDSDEAADGIDLTHCHVWSRLACDDCLDAGNENDGVWRIDWTRTVRPADAGTWHEDKDDLMPNAVPQRWVESEASWKPRRKLEDVARQLRRAQIRVCRRVLLDALPYEIKRWIVRMYYPGLTFFDIKRLWRNMDEAGVIARDNIKLLPVWLWSGGGLEAVDKPYDWKTSTPPDPLAVKQLRQKLIRMGATPHIWRMLCEHGQKLFPSVPWWWTGDRADQSCEAIAYLHLLELDGVTSPLPENEKREIWMLVTYDNVMAKALARNKALCRATIRHVRKQFRNRDDVDFAYETLHVIEVLLSAAKSSVDANQKQSNWSWWLGEYLRVNTESRSWLPLVEEFETGPYAVVPLCSEASVLHEGETMRHCVGRCIENCVENRVRLFSIREGADKEKHLATVAISVTRRIAPHILEARGFANAELSNDLRAVTDELLNRCREALNDGVSVAGD